MDPDVIMKKLEALGRCLARIRSNAPANATALKANMDAQDIIVVNLERAVQQCVDIGSHLLADVPGSSPSTMTAVFEELAKTSLIPDDLASKLTHAVGFRNIAVHEYDELDWDIVQSIITKGLVDFEVFARYVLEVIDTQAANK